MDSLAERVKNRRIALRLTQGQIAKISELNQSDVSKIEKGRILETTKLLGLARALQCNPDWLETGKGDVIPTNGLIPPRATDNAMAQGYGGVNLKQALDLIETALIRLDMSGRERIAPLFESFARSPGAVIKADISLLLETPSAVKSYAAEKADLQKTG